jgi:Fe-S cluster biogenesis protein NfuA
MKLLSCTFLFLLTAFCGYAQSKALQQNNEWLEKNLNGLIAKDGSDNTRFRFDDCDARMEIEVKEKDGFNLGMNMGCSLSQIEKVSYQKEGNSYKLKLHMKEEAKNDSFSFSVSTDDEKLMREIKQRLETSIATCKSMDGGKSKTEKGK